MENPDSQGIVRVSEYHENHLDTQDVIGFANAD